MTKPSLFIPYLGILVALSAPAELLAPSNCHAPSLTPAQQILLKLIEQQKQLSPKQQQKAIPPKVLAPILWKASLRYKIHPSVLMAVIMHESRYDVNAHNRRTHDHGLMQINGRTAKSLALNNSCLYNVECNVMAGASVLAYMKRRFGHERNWIARYNVGTHPKKSNNSTYLAYAAKVGAYL
jgi:soluble lytic murein transglycosylase-like protein